MHCCSRSFIILMCVSLLLLHPVWGEDALTASPAIRFQEDVFTFQPILEGESVYVTFEFSNRGEEPLVIHDAVTSCGCTTADYPSYPLRSGESGKIKTTFKSTGHGGENDIVLLIKSNDPIASVKKLHIRGRVIRQWKAQPDRFILTNLRPNRRYTQRLQINNFMDESLQIKEVVAGNPHLHLLAKAREVAPRGEETIAFEVSTKNLKPGRIVQSSIRLEVVNAEMQSVEIPVLIKLK
ncbi:MAG: DUF1573 domain-containing protein [Deltaproteobacteria bacterium]|nr:MAG: DUF1573 domain-containing protein [Deltaproteobacteria bacterium]